MLTVQEVVMASSSTAGRKQDVESLRTFVTLTSLNRIKLQPGTVVCRLKYVQPPDA